MIQKQDPIAALIQRAAATPAKGEIARFERRFNAAGTATVVLADVSGSMEQPAGEVRRVDRLRDALEGLSGVRLVAFASAPVELRSAADLPAPAGGTALHLAIDMAAGMRPARTVVVSDGEPDDEEAAIAAADRLPGRIDVIYCGPEGNARARAFLMRLARTGGGAYVDCNLRVNPLALRPAIRGLLGSGR